MSLENQCHSAKLCQNYSLFLGDAKYGGGGAGGRIAIYHTDQNHYAGRYDVSGGKGYSQWAGSGTVYIKDLSVSPATTQLITDNGGKQVTQLCSIFGYVLRGVLKTRA